MISNCPDTMIVRTLLLMHDCDRANTKNLVHKYKTHLTKKQDELLDSFFFMKRRPYTKLYSYHHLINGFAVDLTAAEVCLYRLQPKNKLSCSWTQNA